MNREKQIQEMLDEVRDDNYVEYSNDRFAVVIPEPAYDETFALLKKLPDSVSLPLMMTLDAGGIGLQWNWENCIATMSLYGDGKLNFVYLFDGNDQIASTVSLGNNVLIPIYLALLI